jgi:hypothetical protein
MGDKSSIQLVLVSTIEIMLVTNYNRHLLMVDTVNKFWTIISVDFNWSLTYCDQALDCLMCCVGSNVKDDKLLLLISRLY